MWHVQESFQIYIKTKLKIPFPVYFAVVKKTTTGYPAFHRSKYINLCQSFKSGVAFLNSDKSFARCIYLPDPEMILDSVDVFFSGIKTRRGE